jgi:hypothetical protein
MTGFLMCWNCYTSVYLFFQCCLEESTHNFLFCITCFIDMDCTVLKYSFSCVLLFSLGCNISDRKPYFQLHETTSFLNQFCFCEGIGPILSTLHICISFAMYCDLNKTEDIVYKICKTLFS